MKNYIEPELKVMTFDVEDIITISGSIEDDVVVLPEQGFPD